MLTPHPAADLKGHLELWSGKGPGSRCQTIDLGGWRAMQGHHWGNSHPRRYVWLHCNDFEEMEEDAYFEAALADVKILGIFPKRMMLGRVVIGDTAYRFDSWRNMFGGGTYPSGDRWGFEMRGPGGRVVGQISSKGDATLRIAEPNPSGRIGQRISTSFAELSLKLTRPNGDSRELHSDRGTFEQGLPLAKNTSTFM